MGDNENKVVETVNTNPKAKWTYNLVWYLCGLVSGLALGFAIFNCAIIS